MIDVQFEKRNGIMDKGNLTGALQLLIDELVARLAALKTKVGSIGTSRDPDPCAAEQALFDAAVIVIEDLDCQLSAANAIKDAAQMALQQCREANP